MLKNTCARFRACRSQLTFVFSRASNTRHPYLNVTRESYAQNYCMYQTNQLKYELTALPNQSIPTCVSTPISNHYIGNNWYGGSNVNTSGASINKTQHVATLLGRINEIDWSRIDGHFSLTQKKRTSIRQSPSEMPFFLVVSKDCTYANSWYSGNKERPRLPALRNLWDFKKLESTSEPW